MIQQVPKIYSHLIWRWRDSKINTARRCNLIINIWKKNFQYSILKSKYMVEKRKSVHFNSSSLCTYSWIVLFIRHWEKTLRRSSTISVWGAVFSHLYVGLIKREPQQGGHRWFYLQGPANQTCEQHPVLSLAQQKSRSSPFRVEQVSDFLIVNLHVGHLHSEALSLTGLLHSPVEQGAAEPGDQTRLLRRAHHGVGLPRAWGRHSVYDSYVFFQGLKGTLGCVIVEWYGAWGNKSLFRFISAWTYTEM